ncbi:V-type proton ATPase subunit D-like [Pararge aegeria]|uniref:Jg16815 protein n=1 Tax=Pararge aegeria aegeria TaxID=348720 RepID=A0A8S4SGF5_9NEOP|nr:V-type proton ATPase subunit D-like [Pararge aegeria]CAH2265158.1 jg16815 [Pararge aegeria aegeria]
MNFENRYPVTASLFMLREIKNRQEKVNRGYQLLKRKAEALRIRGRQAASELATTQAILGHTLREAYISLAAVKFTNGESNALVLENVGEAQIRVQRIPENISGVTTVSLQVVEDATVNDALRFAGLGAGGHRTTETKKAFRDTVKILIKFASLRNSCLLLDEAIKSTLRKVNGIEKVILPKLRNTEKYILTEMDEREREDFHRLKMVKAKKNMGQLLPTVKSIMKPIYGDIDNSSVPSVSQEDSLECIALSPITISTTTVSGGDFKPICYPHNWDDEDLLF